MDHRGAALSRLAMPAVVAHHRPRWLAPVAAVAPIVVGGGLFVWPLATLAAQALRVGALRHAVTDPGIRRVAWFTLWQAAVSTILTVAAGLGPAFVLSRFRFPGRRWLLALVTVPFVLPTVVVAAAVIAVLPASLGRSVWAVLGAHVFFNLAVVVRVVGASWAHLPADLSGAARTLGASRRRAFTGVSLPLLRPSITAAASIVFLFTFTSFGVVQVIGRGRLATLEVETYRQAILIGDTGVAAAISLIQLAALGALLAWWSASQRRHAVALALRPPAAAARPRTRSQRVGVLACATGLVAFVGAPMAAVVERSLRRRGGHTLAAWRGVMPKGRPGLSTGVATWSAVTTSLRDALVCAVVATAVGTAAVCAIAYSRRWGGVLDAGLMVPLGTSAITVGLGLLITFDTAPFDLRASPVLVPLGHALVAIPFVVRVCLPVLRAVPDGLRDAAGVLGASPWRVFTNVDLPVLGRSIAVGAGFAAAISLGEFGATSLLTRSGHETLPIAIADLLARPGDLVHARAYVLVTVLMVLTMVCVGVAERLRPDTATGF